MHETLLQNCSTDKDESRGSIANETLSQYCSADEGELVSMEEEKPEFTITKQKKSKNEVIYDVPNYSNVSNIFECGRKLLYRIDVLYKTVYTATPKEEHFRERFDYLNKYNDSHGKTQKSSRCCHQSHGRGRRRNRE